MLLWINTPVGALQFAASEGSVTLVSTDATGVLDLDHASTLGLWTAGPAVALWSGCNFLVVVVGARQTVAGAAPTSVIAVYVLRDQVHIVVVCELAIEIRSAISGDLISVLPMADVVVEARLVNDELETSAWSGQQRRYNVVNGELRPLRE